MLTLPIAPETVEAMADRVYAAYLSATPEQRREGAQWYRDAHALAREVGHGDTAKGAGIIAALSPQKRWHTNVVLAKHWSDGGSGGQVKDACRKAAAIRDGVPPEFVLPMEAKTGQFYRCIVDPTDADAVCVDRHAHDIAVGETYGEADRGLGSKVRYNAVAAAYRDAAARLGVTPATVQAVTWVAHTA